MRKFIFFLVVNSLVFVNMVAQDPCIQRQWHESYKTTWLLNDGERQSNHIQHGMEHLYVSADGKTATVTHWDEGGSNVIVFDSAGTVHSVPTNSGTGGWGRMSMTSVAMDDQYVYQLLSQHGCDGANTSLNQNQLPQFPKCGDDFTWKTVRRYKIGSGAGAPFPTGYGFAGDMLLVREGNGGLKGVTVYMDELIVADEVGDSIKVYDKATMNRQPLRKFHVAGGVGQMSPDNAGGLWILQADQRTIIRVDRITGEVMDQQITFPDTVVPSAFFVDTLRSRILVADNGISQNIRFYTSIYSTPAFDTTFGHQYGLFSGVAGKYEPLKFFDLSGVGVDSSGIIYVTNSAPAGGAILQAYNPDGTLLWDKKGLVFTATASADPDNLEDVYTFDKRVKMDYSKAGAGSEWSFEAYTLNRFKYPDDPRLHGGFYTSSWIKYIDGQKFLFATDMYASQLAGFRFSPDTDGEIAIPCLLMNISGWGINKDYPIQLGEEKDFIWMDLNGDGSIQDNEFTFKAGFDNPYSMSVWVDATGNIWKGIREKGARFIPIKEVNQQGVPVYDFADSKVLDIANGAIGINGVKRLMYNSESDELFITGFSDQKPDVKASGERIDTWWAMGSTICMYKGVMDTLAKNENVNFKNVIPDWKIFVPFAADGDPGNELNSKSFTVEGDYLFTAIARKGLINVYKRMNGEYLGQITPGVEINKESGWTDINYSINAYNSGEEFLIFNEENANAKVVLYRVTSFLTDDTYFPDLIVEDLKVIDINGVIVTDLKQNEKVRFRATVKNQGPGVAPEGSSFTSGKSIVVTYIVKNLATNTNKIFMSDTCTIGLNSNDSVVLTSFSLSKNYEWLVEKGKFQITARVGNSINECNTSNNTTSSVFNSYDTVHIATNPQNVSVYVGKTATFEVEALGDGPIQYQWFVNDVLQLGQSTGILTILNVPGDLNQAKVKVIASNHLGSDTSASAVLTVIDPFGPSRKGYLLQQDWYGIPGTSINDLRSVPNFPDQPDSMYFINKFEIKSNAGDSYGSKVSGWLIPPVSGQYVLYIASDDNGELWLSSDSLPENIGNDPIAHVPDWTNSREYTRFPEQTSDSIYLEAGKYYYAEALMKEGGGGDHLSVRWRLPSGSFEDPIPSSRLAFLTGNPFTGIIRGIKNSEKLLLYPSPAKDILHVSQSGLNGTTNICIVDMYGRKALQIVSNVTSPEPVIIDISNLKTGIYILVLSKDGVSKSAKFCIE